MGTFSEWTCMCNFVHMTFLVCFIHLGNFKRTIFSQILKSPWPKLDFNTFGWNLQSHFRKNSSQKGSCLKLIYDLLSGNHLQPKWCSNLRRIVNFLQSLSVSVFFLTFALYWLSYGSRHYRSLSLNNNIICCPTELGRECQSNIISLPSQTGLPKLTMACIISVTRKKLQTVSGTRIHSW